MILVVGSTGFLGSDIVRRLAGSGQQVRALVRASSDPAKRAQLEAWGATLFEGDLKDQASLQRACAGVDTVISTASATLSRGGGDNLETVDRQGQMQLVEAAEAAGVRHFIYVSFSGNNTDVFPLSEAKRGVEKRLREGRIKYTIVRPSFFMEVWLSPMLGFDPAGGKVRIYGSGDQPMSMISVPDVGAYVAGCVNNAAAESQTIELGGPDPTTYNAIVGMFEKALGRSIAREHVPLEALEAQFRAASDPIEKTFAALMLGAARGDAIDVRPALEKVPMRLTPVSAFVARTAAP
jgi:NADH dehydrogenase